MAGYWYVGADANRQGPVEFDEIARLVGVGVVTRDTLVWTEGMPQWTAAADVAALQGSFAAPPPPSAAPTGWPTSSSGTPRVAAHASSAGIEAGLSGPLIPGVETWPLFGRGLLAMIGNIFVVPSPWTSTGFWKYLGETTALPNGQRFAFDGKPADIWWVFVLQGLALYANGVKYGGILGLIANIAFPFLVLRWFCSKLRVGEGGPNLSFQGAFLPYLGWNVLFFISIFTIVGWAWVAQYYMRWACANVGGPLSFDFQGKGLDILWRSLVTTIACGFLIPIPWVLAWFARWYISQIVVLGPRAA